MKTYLATAIRAEVAPTTMTCNTCGNSIVIQPGETILPTDERLCSHIAVRS